MSKGATTAVSSYTVGQNIDAAASERAFRAVRRTRQLLPALNSFARTLTKRADVRVEISQNVSCTDGKIIHVRPPLEMGDVVNHDRQNCGRRNEDSLQVCPACQQVERVMRTLVHEIAHIAFDSFEGLKDKDRAELVARSLNEFPGDEGTRYAKLQRILADLDAIGRADYVSLSNIVSPYMLPIVNALEDARVNRAMYGAREGTYHWFRAGALDVFKNGILLPDGSVRKWSEMGENAQVIIGLYCKASGFDYAGWFVPAVEGALNDPELTRASARVATARTASSVYRQSFGILEHLRRLGFCKRVEDVEDDPPPPPEPPTPPPSEDAEENDAEPTEGDGADEDPADEQDNEPGDGATDSDESDDDPAPGDTEDQDADAEPQETDGDGDESEDDGDDPDPESGDGESDDTDETSDDDESGTGTPDDGDEESDDDTGATGAADTDDDELDGDDADDQSTGATDDDTDQSGDDTDDDPDDESGTGGTGADDDEDWFDNDDDESADDGDPDDDELESDIFSDGSPTPPSIPEETDPAEEDRKNEDPDESTDLLQMFGGHDDPPPTSEQRREDAEVDRAIAQSDAFDTASRSVYGVNVHTFDNESQRSRDLCWPWIDRDPEHVAHQIDAFTPPESLIANTLLKARTVFAANKRGHRETGHKSGRVNGRQLASVMTGNDRVFTRPILPKKRDYFFVIALDCSGSTSGSRVERIKALAMAQGELLHRLGVKFAIYAHTGMQHEEPRSKGGHQYNGSLFDVDVFVVKEEHEVWTDVQRHRLVSLQGSMNNLDGHALEFMRKRADQSNATDKIILYVTDGAMPAANKYEEQPILEREIKLCAKKGYVLMGCGIDTDSPVQYGLETVVINDIDDLPSLIKAIERKLVRT